MQVEASFCFVHNVPSTQLCAQLQLVFSKYLWTERMNEVEGQGTTKILLNKKDAFGRIKPAVVVFNFTKQYSYFY